jgi:hypothetical protein
MKPTNSVTVAPLLKKFPITWATWFQSTPSHPFSVRSILILFSGSSFPFRFSNENSVTASYLSLVCYLSLPYYSPWSSLLKSPVISFPLSPNIGRAIAQAVSRRLPTAAARDRAQVRSCGICGGRSGTGACFLRVLRSPMTILIPPTAPHSASCIIRGWYNRPTSGRRTMWTQSRPTPRN